MNLSQGTQTHNINSTVLHEALSWSDLEEDFFIITVYAWFDR